MAACSGSTGAHHWIVYGGVGRCKHCGAVRSFASGASERVSYPSHGSRPGQSFTQSRPAQGDTLTMPMIAAQVRREQSLVHHATGCHCVGGKHDYRMHRRAAGLCVDCGVPSDGRRRCTECKAKERARWTR